ncbi:FAD-dependent oxidoreductase, partial [Cloacibacillus evryensis]|uniref:FAD-dependent oxidoreductase n=1 Tax=Cloacibacillus evryensis TaxID=508460 RepID=UPI00210A3405
NILSASGSKPSRTQFPGCELPGVITSDELLADSGGVKKKLLVFGAGVIAVEFATVFANLGCEVAMVVRSRLMRVWDSRLIRLWRPFRVCSMGWPKRDNFPECLPG